jgi:outer membrane protein assembly factor BamB
MQNQVYAVDALGSGDGNAKLLWKQDLSETIAGLNSRNENQQNQILMGRVIFNGVYTPMGPVLGPITGRQVCFQRVRNLVAIDALTGQTVWTRQNVAGQSVLFGDDEYIFCIPPDANNQRALVFRAADGEPLGERAIPQSESLSQFNPRLTTLGRHVLIWAVEGDKRVVRLFDPWHQRDVWRAEPVSAGAKCVVWQQQVVALMEPDGRVQLFGLADGRKLLDEKVEPVTKDDRNTLAEIYLSGSRDHFVLFANNVSQHDVAVSNVNPIPYNYTNPFNPRINGRIYGFDRQTGKQLWTTAVARQGIFLEQPSELPVIFMAATTYEQNVPTRQLTLSLLCLDKRTGRTVHGKTAAASTIGYFELIGDSDKKTVDLRASRESVKMTFTDQPLPEPPAPGANQAKPAAEKQSSLLRPVINAIIRSQETKK